MFGTFFDFICFLRYQLNTEGYEHVVQYLID